MCYSQYVNSTFFISRFDTVQCALSISMVNHHSRSSRILWGLGCVCWFSYSWAVYIPNIHWKLLFFSFVYAIQWCLFECLCIFSKKRTISNTLNTLLRFSSSLLSRNNSNQNCGNSKAEAFVHISTLYPSNSECWLHFSYNKWHASLLKLHSSQHQENSFVLLYNNSIANLRKTAIQLISIIINTRGNIKIAEKLTTICVQNSILTQWWRQRIFF